MLEHLFLVVEFKLVFEFLFVFFKKLENLSFLPSFLPSFLSCFLRSPPAEVGPCPLSSAAGSPSHPPLLSPARWRPS
jgi:hypothetical protein